MSGHVTLIYLTKFAEIPHPHFCGLCCCYCCWLSRVFFPLNSIISFRIFASIWLSCCDISLMDISIFSVSLARLKDWRRENSYRDDETENKSADSWWRDRIVMISSVSLHSGSLTEWKKWKWWQQTSKSKNSWS